MPLKYSSYALLSALILAASCSQENVEEDGRLDSGGRIEFMTSLPELGTRATEVDKESLDVIQVSAFTVRESGEIPYFSDKIFSRDGNSGKYVNFDPECIWPNNNDLIRFAAFSPSCDEMIEAGGNAAWTVNKLTDFRIAKDIADQFDFVTAISSGCLLDNEETGIDLRMRHQLSRIKINAWGNSAIYDLEIAGVRIGGVATSGSFSFAANGDTTDGGYAGAWEEVGKGCVEYIFRAGDQTVTLDKTDGSPVSAESATSILGAKIGGLNGYDNSAMLIPSANTPWDYKETPANGANHSDGMYISVLLRATDTTPYPATNGTILYPSSGDTKTIYLAVDAEDGKTVMTRLYLYENEYFTDEDHTQPYDLTANNAEVKAYGWAALPVQDTLEPGRIFTYTLNYSYGVGLRDPEDSRPGDPIINDRVLVNVEVSDWLHGVDITETVPRK